MVRRPIGALTAIVLVMGMAVPAQADFVDDEGHPGERALEWLADRGVIDGCDPPDNRMSCPERVLTRAEAAKILVQLARVEGVLDPERPGEADHFEDDDALWGGVAEAFIGHLADLGIVHGCDPPTHTRFCPNQHLQRGQILKMVVGTFGLSAPDSFDSPWDDTGGEFFEEAARVAAFHGLLDASGGELDGYVAVTRAEFARVVVAVFEPDLCADRPFPADRVAGLESVEPGVSFTAYAFDVGSGCAYAMNPRHRQQTASVFKVMVMGGALMEAQTEGRAPSATELSWLEPMITESANPPVRDLWSWFGGAPWYTEQAERFGLDDTVVVGDDERVWGRTTTSAQDQGDLFRQVLLGHWGPLEAPGRSIAYDLMTSVIPSQTWGVTEGVPEGWTVAQKNGFAGQTANSVGVVYDADGAPKYVVAILTDGWDAWPEGVAAVEDVAGWVSEALAR